MAGKRLAAAIFVHDEKSGESTCYEPGQEDQIPKDVLDKLGDHVWAGEDDQDDDQPAKKVTRRRTPEK